MTRIVINIYFFVITGGFILATAAVNFFTGKYEQGAIGYVYCVPAVLLIILFFVNFSKIRVHRQKMVYSFFPACLYFFWLFLNSIICDTFGTDMGRELMVYSFFYSFVPYLCGFLISGKHEMVSSKNIFIIPSIVILLSMISLKVNWNNVFFDRYRISGFAQIGCNVVGLVLGGYSIVMFREVMLMRGVGGHKILLLSAVFIGCILTLFFVGSMSSILAVGGSLLLLYCLGEKRRELSLKKIKKIIFYLALFLLAVLVIVSILESAKKDMGFSDSFGKENVEKYTYRVQMLFEKNYEAIDYGRYFYNNLFIRQFGENPFLGKGYGSREGLRCDPHNFVVELLGETGLISLLLFISVIMFPIKYAIKVFKFPMSFSGIEMLIGILVFILMFGALFTGSIFINPQLWFIIGIIPCLRNNCDYENMI